MQKNMLYADSDKAHVSDSCFPVDHLDNALSLESFLFEQQRLAMSSPKSVRQMVLTSVQKAGSALLQAGSLRVPGKNWGLLGGPRRSMWLLIKHSSQSPVEWQSLVKDLWAFTGAALLVNERPNRCKRST